jgi:hypothetical protein
MDPVKIMFTNIINQKNANEDILNQAYTYACKTKDMDLLETIARHTLVGSDIDLKISNRTELPVLNYQYLKSGPLEAAETGLVNLVLI